MSDEASGNFPNSRLHGDGGLAFGTASATALPTADDFAYVSPAPAPAPTSISTPSTMASLITHTPAAEVTAEYKEIAAAWPVWDSRTHPQKPAKSGKFPFDYNGDYATERILITKGSATLTPTDGSPQVSISAGDSVFFHCGFACEWEVHKPMLKHYAYYGEDNEEMPAPPGISCDICSADCWASSYLFIDGEGTELDLCPKCFKKGSKKYSGAEYQCGGEPAPLPQKKKRKR
jgi:uncharacterized cupin superfamily protein